MSYNQGYGQGGQGYGQYNPYGEQNPYADNNTQGGYGSPQQGSNQSPRPDGYGSAQPAYGQNSYGQYQDERTQGGYEMGPMGSRGASDPNRILNEVRQIDQEIDSLEAASQKLKSLQNRFMEEIDASTTSPTQKQVAELTRSMHGAYTALTSRMTTLKRNPESGNPRNIAQVGKTDRRLKESLNKLMQLESNYLRGFTDQLARQYRVVRPEASDQEIREYLKSPGNQQVFSQAMMSSDRRDQAQSVYIKVEKRHEQIQLIEQDFVELTELLNILEAAVVEQEVAVNQIDTKAQETNTDVEHAGVQLDGAVEKARGARNKKMICAGIVILIIIIIVIVVAVAVTLTRNPNNNNNNSNNRNP